MKHIKNNIYLLLIFIISFLLVMYFLDFLPIGKIPNKATLLKKQSGGKQEYTTINGQKVSFETFTAEYSAEDTFNKMKLEIANNPNQKIINHTVSNNRYYLSYSEEGKIVSVVITAQTPQSCQYTIHRGLSENKDEVIELPDFPVMSDAVPLLNVKGSGDKIVFSYATKFNEKEILSYYRKEMQKKGYREEDMTLPDNLKIDEANSTSILFIKDRKNVSISIMPDPSSEGNMVYVVGT